MSISRSSALPWGFLGLIHLYCPDCRHTCLALHHAHRTRQLLTPAQGCGHGGTRNISTSCSVHTWSVNPAAIAGVPGRHRLTESLPLVGRGVAKCWRRLRLILLQSMEGSLPPRRVAGRDCSRPAP